MSEEEETPKKLSSGRRITEEQELGSSSEDAESMEEETPIPFKKSCDHRPKRQAGSSEDKSSGEEPTNKGSGKKAKLETEEESLEESPVAKIVDKGSKKEGQAPSKVLEKKEYPKS
ncbi:unnamed protein product [Calypogeia fissa]